MTTPHLGTRHEWLTQRKALLEKEKAFTRLKDELAVARRALPWVKVEKPYMFETTRGEASLAALFGARSQLVVYHLMYDPNAKLPCKSCSFCADNWQGAVPTSRPAT